MSEKMSGDESINWEAVAKALGVSRDTLPVPASDRREVDKTEPPVLVIGDAVRQVRQVAGDYALTDDEWSIVEPLVPRGPGARGKRDRLFLNACIYRQRTLGSGREWASAPEAREIPLKSLQGRFYRWCMSNFFQDLSAGVEASGLDARRKAEFRAMADEATVRRVRVLALRAV